MTPAADANTPATTAITKAQGRISIAIVMTA
jgi:hypothetical protein